MVPLRNIVAFAIAAVACRSATDQLEPPPPPPPPVPRQLLLWTGASAAFVNDTVLLPVLYGDSAGFPISGVPITTTRPRVVWRSSDSSVFRFLSDTSDTMGVVAGVALDTGSVTLRAKALDSLAFTLDTSLVVVPPISGRMVWIRDYGLVQRVLPSRDVTGLPPFSYPGAPFGRPNLTTDAKRAAAYGPRPTAAAAYEALFVVDLSTGAHQELLDSMPGDQIWPVWLPGDSLIAFLYDGGGAFDVWTVRPDGTGARRRTNLHAGFLPEFDVTPDGHLIISLPQPQRGHDLFELTIDGDTIARLTASPTLTHGLPAVSPDGRTIAFVLAGPGIASNQVWLINRDGSNPRPFLPPSHSSLVVSQAWLPDGRYVLVEWGADIGSLDIYAVRVSDQRAVRLTRSGVNGGAVAR